MHYKYNIKQSLHHTNIQLHYVWVTWSRLDRLLGSWLKAWYWPRNLSPAAILRNFFKSTTYRALVEIWKGRDGRESRCEKSFFLKRRAHRNDFTSKNNDSMKINTSSTLRSFYLTWYINKPKGVAYVVSLITFKSARGYSLPYVFSGPTDADHLSALAFVLPHRAKQHTGIKSNHWAFLTSFFSSPSASVSGNLCSLHLATSCHMISPHSSRSYTQCYNFYSIPNT